MLCESAAKKSTVLFKFSSGTMYANENLHFNDKYLHDRVFVCASIHQPGNVKTRLKGKMVFIELITRH